MKKNELVFLLGSTTLLVFAWIGISIYSNSITSTVSPTLTTQTQPISPNFDMQTISMLKQRKRVAPLLEPVQNIATKPTTTQPATSSATPTPSGNRPTGTTTPSPTLPPARGI